MPRAKGKKKPDPETVKWQTYVRRTGQMWHNHKARAADAGQWVVYTLDELRQLVKKALAHGQCPYCQGELTEANFSADHRVPVSRTGSWALENILICCMPCNAAKGPLDHVEWRQLLHVMAEWAPSVRQHTLARLKMGAKYVKAGAIYVPRPPSQTQERPKGERSEAVSGRSQWVANRASVGGLSYRQAAKEAQMRETPGGHVNE